MNVNFNTVINRKNTGSLKWDFMKEKLGIEADDLFPMWVSDYDFKAPESVVDSLHQRVEHGVFGYAERDTTYFKAIEDWYINQYDITIDTKSIATVHGVLPGLSIAIQMLTNESDGVVIQTPGYGAFRKIIGLNDRAIIESPLMENNGAYSIDFIHLEECFKLGAKVFIFCNPHNPIGKAWNKQDVIRIAELCHQYNIWLLSDEIWGDLTLNSDEYFSLLKLPETLQKNIIIATSASKTFGLSSLRVSNFFIPNSVIREQFLRRLDAHGMDVFNCLSLTAATTAYQTGESWLTDLKCYLSDNIELVSNFLESEIPMLSFQKPDAGYLAWINCKALGLSDKELETKLVTAGIAPSMGISFGSNGSGYIRLNLGCPRSELVKSLDYLKLACHICP